ncbi:2-succinylbenzoate--CoA ligase [Arenibacter antarcticus]|uniref:AMP-binding protein n=1 Tax=Arenibacter antarcticus TaxID=2040469 RepID=A0ABW5VFG2_9FLAO|nr:AMP-binding protein [Arenibacter sp. H213]MCM4168266.1 O-succinylbenzoic acid--CoA ligase [Arenibacter sp. H213]
MDLNYNTIHPKFKFNGNYYGFKDLQEQAYCLVKEGEGYEIAIGDFLLDWLDGSDVVKVNTSGSTGIPKIITLQKKHMVNSALATGTFFNMREGTKALHCLPTTFIAGKMMLVRAIVLGWELQCVAPNSHPLQSVKDYYDFGAMVPLQIENSLSCIGQIGTVIVGGAPMSAALKRNVALLPVNVFETYGMTETITHIAVKKVIHKQSSDNETDGGVAFIALPKVYFSTDERGCLVINASHISDVEVVTNDVVRLHSDTEFEWLGRFDNVVNSGGIKLIPEQIESKLLALLTSRFFVAGIVDATLGHKLILVVEGLDDSSQLQKDIQTLTSLDKYEIPKEIYTIPKFMETGSGKVNRGETLRALELN